MRLFGEVVVTMLVILDAPGNVPIFLSVTRQLSVKERHRAAYLSIATAFLVIAMFAIGGQTILDYLNVSVPALQSAGGLLLLLVALQLLYGQSGDDGYAEATPEQRTSIAMVPLGTPLLAGPGAIVATIIFFGKADGWGQWFTVLSGTAVALFISMLLLRFSGIVQRIVRPSGVLLLGRLAGMILAAIAVQGIADGVEGLFNAAIAESE
jgi:multiple antibiotic resistance protein